jgi:hypothetical protein
MKNKKIKQGEDDIHKMFSDFLKFVKTDDLQGSFIDYYEKIQNEEHLELNLTARN